jgi:cell division transport system permease protein
MKLPFTANAHERKLIPDGRFSGAMPWVMAIMLFLTLLACAAALALVQSVRAGGEELSRQATVQILENDPAARRAQQQRVAARLKSVAGIEIVRAVPDKEARSLLEPWLGDAAADADIPVPALIDVTFAEPPERARLTNLRRDMASLAPSIRIDSNADWLQPWFSLMRSILWVLGGIVLLLLAATAATVMLAVRGALNTHQSTIEIMHMMGSTDMQAARLFQRRVALDSLFGGAIGFAAALAVMLLLKDRFSALDAGLLAGASIPIYGWPLLLLIPLAVTGLSMMMARWTVLSALKKIL